MKGKKDIHKLVKKTVVAKDGRVMTVYIDPNKGKKRSLLDILLEFFGLKHKEQVEVRIKEDYEKHGKDLNIDYKEWKRHISEYFANKSHWDEYFSKNKHEEIEGEEEQYDDDSGSDGETTGTQKGKKKEKEKSKKSKGKIVKKGTEKYRLDVLEALYNLYGTKKSNVTKETNHESDRHTEESKDRHGNKPTRGGVSGASRFQPYAEYGIWVARDKFTQQAKADYLSDNIRKSLRQHQIDFINLAIEKFGSGEKGIMNMDGTGAGKTRQELGLAVTYREKHGKPALIVTENERIYNNSFKNDAKSMGLDVVLLTGKETERDIDSYHQQGKICVALYNRLEKLNDTKLGDKFGLVIFDESHNLKNVEAAKTKEGIELIDKVKNVALFSATPIDKAEHTYYICKAMNLNFMNLMSWLGYSLQRVTFRNRSMRVWRTTEKKNSVAKKLGGFFDSVTQSGLSVKREVSLKNLDLSIKNVEMTEADKAKYENLIKVAEAEIKYSNNGLKKAYWLMKIRRFLEGYKVKAAVDTVKEAISEKKQVVIFATRVNSVDDEINEEENEGTLKQISEELSKQGIKHVNVYSSPKNTEELIAKFQKGDVPVILTNPQTGGTGINLDDSVGNKPRKAIIITPPFSAMEMIQMIGRINRLTTKSRAEAVMFKTQTSIDEWNCGIIANKMTRLGATVQGDYAKIDIEKLEASAMMPDEEIEDTFGGEMVAVDDFVAVDVNTFRDKSYRGEGGEAIPIKPIRKLSDYKEVLKKKEDGTIDYDVEYPDVQVTFGKYKGLELSRIKERDKSYFEWMMSQININANKIKFKGDMNKAYIDMKYFIFDGITIDYGKYRIIKK